ASTHKSLGCIPDVFAPLVWKPGLVSDEDYLASVETILDEVHDGVADKVVLARDLVAHAPGVRDWRGAISKLTEAYPDCQTFAIDGFVGSTPETLARVQRGRLNVRVLAGSIGRGSSPGDDRLKAQQLTTSTKDNDEH
ncbi:MAG: chorismate-binding protein, partial [Pontimonas sp.]